jgi:dihydroorotase
VAYDLVIKGGEVVDPSQGLHGRLDIGIAEGRVAALAPELPPAEARTVLDASDRVVTPGLIDIHTHVAEAIIPLAVAPDEAGVLCGVTSVVDAGSTGYANFQALRQFVIPGARTDVFCFLHLCPVGEALLPEVGWQQVSAEKMLAVIEANRDVVKGVKLRLTVGLMEALGLEAVRAARRVASEAGLPVVVHLGIDTGEVASGESVSAFTREALSLLESGDVLTHAFTRKAGGVIGRDGRGVPGLREALDRGVVLDVASALGHLDFEVARRGMERGFLPATLSTDFTAALLNAPVPFGLPVLMSEFLALGLSLPQVVEMATANPAKVLGEEHTRGSLRVGMPADLCLFQLLGGDFLFVEGREGSILTGERLLVPMLSIKRGVAIETAPRARSYAQWCEGVRPLLTGRKEPSA